MDAGKAVRIVLVEDDADARDSLMGLLEVYGHDVRAVGSASDAMATIDAFRPEVVVLDLGLPDTATGLRLASWLQLRYGPTVVLVVVTGCRAVEDLEAARTAGADYVLVKPVNFKELNAILGA